MLLIILFCVCFLVFAILGFKLSSKRPKGLPPGPRPLPIIGNLHLLFPIAHFALRKLAKKFGPIYSFDFGLTKGVVLNDPILIREAFNLKEFSGRPFNEAMGLLTGDQEGILQAEGDKWLEKRRFALRIMRELGAGKNIMEEDITEDVQEIIEWIKNHNERPVDLQKRFNLAVVNSLWKIVSGEKFHHDDTRLQQIFEELNAVAEHITKIDLKGVLFFFYPGIAKYFPNWSGWNHIVKLTKNRLQMFQDSVTEHKKTFLEHNHRDFVDIFLQEVKNSEDPNSPFHVDQKADQALLSIMADLFTAGSDTTSATLNWAMLYLMHHPEVQEKLYNEMNFIVGKSRAPRISDRKSLPYVEATIAEILRHSSIIMLGVPHCTLEDVNFNGYLIPKGYQVFASIYAANHDPEIWGDPENFSPERFLSHDGKSFQRREELLTFSTGRRSCLGETIARDTLFLFITSIVFNFKLMFDDSNSQPRPSMEAISGMMLCPSPYKIILKERIYT